MRRLAPAVLISLIVSLSTTTAASADTPGCVSRHEYNRIAKGMRMAKVHAIFDTKGASTGLGGATPLYYYPTCARNSQVQVSYNAKNRVVSKSANWFS